MDERCARADDAVSWSALLGYINFSTGKPDPRFQTQLNEAYRLVVDRGTEQPPAELHRLLTDQLAALGASGAVAFKDVAQAESVIALAFGDILPAYRRHHADLLFHLSDRELAQPFFLARLFEAALSQGGPWNERDRIVRGTLLRLNDFAGHRPIAVLESRRKGELYDHERVRPIPLYIKGAGVACGPYAEMLSIALEILRNAPPNILVEAYFDPDLLDEFAFDPRAYDHGHPNDHRPNYRFGEWDPHLIDNQGRYRRYVARHITLAALLDRVRQPSAIPPEELLYESAAVLAGTVLMATGTSGAGPTTHDSTVKLATLVERVARYRDAFYKELLAKRTGRHAERLKEEARRTRQPFGAARQHLNQFIARHRAYQLQQRHLALLFAAIGFSEAGREQASRIPAASVRILCEILGRLTTSHLFIDRGKLAEAAALLPEIDDFLTRGIHCGALADPWNVLGFQGQYSLFQAMEDSMQDPRIEELLQLMNHFFTLYARLLSESAATGDKPLRDRLARDMHRLAESWDRYATYEVSGVLRVQGGEAANSAEHVAKALARWHVRGAGAADLAFWRQHLEGFTTPKAFALVIDALLRKQDYTAAMALLMNWVNNAERIPLEEGDHAFHTLSLRWMLAVWGQQEQAPPMTIEERWSLTCKFFDYLEANAEDYWLVPELESDSSKAKDEAGDQDNLYAAAYEEVTYRDSAADGTEGSLAEAGGPLPSGEFDLEAEGQRLGKRLNFLATVARLWQVSVRALLANNQWSTAALQPAAVEVLGAWLAAAREKHRQAQQLLDQLEAHAIPTPSGAADVFMEYDRRRVLKAQLLDAALGACLNFALSIRALRGGKDMLASAALASSGGPEMLPPPAAEGDWEPLATRLEQALFQGRAAEVQSLLPKFVQVFRKEPLLYRPLEDGGRVRGILRTRMAQATLSLLLEGLPRLGLLRETFHLLQTARLMEQNGPSEGRRVTEFDRLFQPAFQAVVETVVDSAATWQTDGLDAPTLVSLLEELSKSFIRLWEAHSQSMRLSSLETLSDPDQLREAYQFIRRYGRDLFRSKFLILANVRGILTSGVKAFLDNLEANPDPLHPVRLVDEIGKEIARDKAIRFLEYILQTIVENYEEYKDYNNTTTHSDYGENLYVLLEFLRLKAGYDRHAWNKRPWVMAHEVLVRKGKREAAVLWQEALVRETRSVAQAHLEQLTKLEEAHGMRLRTVADRLGERFVQPLAVDRLCALVEPAMEEARKGGPAPSFQRLLEELEAYAAQPTGVGLDVPHWLRRLEWEAHRVRGGKTAVAGLSQNLLRLPRITLTLEGLRQQVLEWDQPLWDDRSR